MAARRSAFINDYADLVEPWKVRLIVERAKRFKIPPQQWPDIQQEIILDIMDFRFDPAKSNGAKLSTLLTAVIDNRLKMILRANSRNQNRNGEPRSNVFEDTTALELDVRQALASLPPRQKAVCLRLSRGESISRIAQTLGCGRATVRRLRDRLRDQFTDMGLDGWVR